MQHYKNLLLTIILTFAPVAIGSIHVWSITLCLGLSIVVFIVELIERRSSNKPIDIGIMGWILIAICLFTILQIAPLPRNIVKIISPKGAEVQLSLYETLLKKESPYWITISIDSYSTILELMKLLSGLFLFLAVRQRVRREGSSHVLFSVVISGFIVAIVFFSHKLAGWQKVYEFYTPVFASTDPLSAPLLNPNHLAGSLNIAAAVAVGLAFSEKDIVKKCFLIFAAGFIGGGVLLTLSRGGILAFICGQLIFTAIRIVQRSEKNRNPGYGELKFLPLALAIALVSGFYVAYGSILKEFLYGDSQKLKIPLDTLPMIKDFWLTGVGRGAFQYGYTMYQKLEDGVTFTHPENFIAQYLSEWGLIAGGILVLALLLLIIAGLLKPPVKGRNAGALTAITTLIIQNFVDFGMEILGVFLPFMVILSSHAVTVENIYKIARGDKQQSQTAIKTNFLKNIRSGAEIAFVVMATVTGIFGFIYSGKYNTDTETNKIKSEYIKSKNLEKFLLSLKEAMKRHPGDYYYPLLGGMKIEHEEGGNPLSYLSRALYLFPKSSMAHLYVARFLAKKRLISQSLLEYMEAARSAPQLAPRVAQQVVKITGSFDLAKTMTRTDSDRFLMYENLALSFMSAGMKEEAEKADDAALKIDPLWEGPIKRKVQRLIESGKIKEAINLTENFSEKTSKYALSMELKGMIEEKRGNSLMAAQMFMDGWKTDPSRSHLLLQAAKNYSVAGKKDLMFKALALYETTAKDDISKGYAVLQRAQIEQSMGMYDKALASYMNAASAIPEEPVVWESIATISAIKKDTAIELRAYKELSRLQPENEKWKEKLKEINERLNSTLLQ